MFKVKINDGSIRRCDSIQEVFHHLVLMFSSKINYYSLETIQSIIKQIIELVFYVVNEQKEKHHKMSSKEKTKLTRFMNMMQKTSTFFDRIKTQESAVRNYYNLILKQEDLGILHGFSLSSSIEKGGNGINPEIKSIYSKFR